MHRIVKLAVGCAVFCGFACITLAQRNPRGNAELTLGGAKVSVEYGRPALGTRTAQDMLGRLKPGGFWRLGADTSTTFSTTTNLKFGDVAVPKGQYSTWVKKTGEKSFELVFNKQHGQWGTEHDPSQDFAGVPLKEAKADAPADRVTLALAKAGDSGVLTIQWGDLKLSAEFSGE